MSRASWPRDGSAARARSCVQLSACWRQRSAGRRPRSDARGYRTSALVAEFAADAPPSTTPVPCDQSVRALVDRRDWTSTSLGPIERWPQALRTLVDVMLGSAQPMFVAWGPERTLLYNAGYAEILATKHPAALGQPFLSVWREIRDDLLPIVDRTYAGEPGHMDDIALT